MAASSLDGSLWVGYDSSRFEPKLASKPVASKGESRMAAKPKQAAQTQTQADTLGQIVTALQGLVPIVAALDTRLAALEGAPTQAPTQAPVKVTRIHGDPVIAALEGQCRPTKAA